MPTVDHYCTLEDVNNLVVQQPFTPLSKPSDTQVQALIAAVATLIDANIGTIYQVPVVAGPLALQLLRDLNAWGAAGRAQEARQTAATPELAGTKSVWTKKFEEWLEMLVDPTDPFILPDAPRNPDFVEKVASQITDSNVLSYPDDESNDDDNIGNSRPSQSQVF